MISDRISDSEGMVELIQVIELEQFADVAKLADALDLGSSSREGV